MEKIDASCLETVGFMRYIPGDLTDPGELQVEAIFDAEVGVPVNGVVETITVTFPISNPDNAAAATLSGTGFIMVTTLPNMAINELMVLGLTIAFDGYTGPVFTAEALTVQAQTDAEGNPIAQPGNEE